MTYDQRVVLHALERRSCGCPNLPFHDPACRKFATIPVDTCADVRVPIQPAEPVPTHGAAGETLALNAGNVQVLLNLLWPGNRFIVDSAEHDGEVSVVFRDGRPPNVVHGRIGEPVLPLLLAVQKAVRRHGSDLL